MSAALEQTQKAYPSRISHIILRSLAEVLGDSGIETVLHTARLDYIMESEFPPTFDPGITFEEVGKMMEAVERIYGISQGRALVHKAGHVSFRHWVQALRGVMGFADIAFRILPLKTRVRIGLEVTTEILNRYAQQGLALGENGDSYFVTSDSAGFSTGRQAQSPACDFLTGLFEEVLFWVTRGRRFKVEETTCIACGDLMCTYCIDKVPLR